MTRLILFNLLQLGVTAYAVAKGGAPERLIGIGLLAAAVATRLAQTGGLAVGAPLLPGVFAVDLALLALLVGIMIRADRFWPTWVLALQLLGTGAHVVRALDPQVNAQAYAILISIWSYPILLILAAGTVRHVRRTGAPGGDRDWSGDR